MKLEEYLKSEGISQIHFAKLLEITDATIRNIIKGSDCPVSTAKKIIKMSKGKVKLKDLGPDI